jgi:dinuclear metal center YbgI/SA1388 family protein
VLLAVDVTPEVLGEAVSVGAQLVLSHHPLIFRGLQTVSEDAGKGAIITTAIRNNIALYSAHTNADVVEDGVSATIAKRLGLEDIRPLVSTEAGVGHGRVGVLPKAQSLAELVDKLLEMLPATTRGVSATAGGSTVIRTVALCGGAGDAFIANAKSAGADVYITSDLRHHVSQEAGLPLVDVSHWASESLWLEVAAKQLASRCPDISFVVSSANTDPWVFNRGRTK